MMGEYEGFGPPLKPTPAVEATPDRANGRRDRQGWRAHAMSERGWQAWIHTPKLYDVLLGLGLGWLSMLLLLAFGALLSKCGVLR